jgi:hypothetical protein
MNEINTALSGVMLGYIYSVYSGQDARTTGVSVIILYL